MTEAACLAATDPDCVQLLALKLERKRVDLDDHTQGFCAVVSIESHADVSEGRDLSTFEVPAVFAYG